MKDSPESVTLRVRREIPQVDALVDQLETRWSSDACFTLSSTAKSTDGAYTIFDEQLGMLREVSRRVEDTITTLVSRIGMHRNTFCRINNFSVELLEGIFLAACGGGFDWKTLGNILRTCKTWYSIISHQPRAYRVVNLAPPNCPSAFADTVAERSIPLSFDVRWVCRSVHEQSAEAWKSEFCSKHILRLGSLEFPVYWSALEQWLLDSPAPELRCCRLFLNKGFRSTAPVQLVKDDVFPQLFDGNHPALHSLELRHLRMAWRPTNYKNLTDLTIRFSQHNIFRTAQDVDDLTIIFRESPNLVYLDLGSDVEAYYFRPSTLDVIPQPGAWRHVLPFLRTLKIYLPQHYVLRLLGIIVLPPEIVSVHIQSFLVGTASRDQDNIPFPIDSLPGSFFDKIDQLTLSRSARNLRVLGSGTWDGRNYDLDLSLPIEHSERTPLVDLMFAIHSPMPRLKRLGLAFDIFSELPRILAQFPTISEIDVVDVSWESQDDSLDILNVFSAENQPLLCRISRWEFRNIPGSPSPIFDIPSKKSALIIALCCLSPQPIIRVDGCIISIATSRKSIRGFIVELAQLGVAPYPDGTFLYEFREDCASPNAVEKLWPEGVPEEVCRLMNKQ